MRVCLNVNWTELSAAGLKNTLAKNLTGMRGVFRTDGSCIQANNVIGSWIYEEWLAVGDSNAFCRALFLHVLRIDSSRQLHPHVHTIRTSPAGPPRADRIRLIARHALNLRSR